MASGVKVWFYRFQLALLDATNKKRRKMRVSELILVGGFR